MQPLFAFICGLCMNPNSTQFIFCRHSILIPTAFQIIFIKALNQILPCLIPPFIKKPFRAVYHSLLEKNQLLFLNNLFKVPYPLAAFKKYSSLE